MSASLPSRQIMSTPTSFKGLQVNNLQPTPNAESSISAADLQFDRAHIWHPYTSLSSPLPVYPVVKAQGNTLQLADGRTLVDGMASWWSAIHGYNHPQLNAAITQQVEHFAHVMFGGITHKPAIELCKKLVAMTPEPLQCVFLSDSGSVSVEVAMKMALQYWVGKAQPNRNQFLTIARGYHGDTFAAMSVCDPINSMHSQYGPILAKQRFVAAPQCQFGSEWQDDDLSAMRSELAQHHQQIAAVILEPIVQNAGGMRFYHPQYLAGVRALCDQYGVLLICDEIATGFGRTGKLFACEHAGVSPDILCLGKALTGGYLTLAATLCSRDVADVISQGPAAVLMHGPTFMANATACSVANASLQLLMDNDWQSQVSRLQQALQTALAPCRQLSCVADVRVLGAIGVVETKQSIDVAQLQQQFVELGVWIRPFGKLVYLMPPYITSDEDIQTLGKAIATVLATLE